MHAAVARQRVIAANLTNVDTPGYKAKELRFSKDLSQAIKEGDPASLSDIFEPGRDLVALGLVVP
jgi:flagellar basal-body rod protein FlgB